MAKSAGCSNRLIRSNGHWRHRHTNFTMPHDCRFNVESWNTEIVEKIVVSREYE